MALRCGSFSEKTLKKALLPKTDNFLAFFIVFEWGRILGSAMDKQEVKCNAKSRRN